MTSSDFRTSKQNLIAELSGLRQQLAATNDRCANVIMIARAKDLEIVVLKAQLRELMRVSRLKRCTCECCKDAECKSCAKRRRAEVRAERALGNA